MAEQKDNNLLIVYHSQSGRNQRLAYVAAQRAAEAGAQVRLLKAGEASTRDLIWSAALLLVFPENFGQLPGELKDFFDRSFYPAINAQLVRPYAAFLCSGNDGEGALRALERIAKGMVLKAVCEPLVCWGPPSEADFDAIGELAEAMVSAIEMGIY